MRIIYLTLIFAWLIPDCLLSQREQDSLALVEFYNSTNGANWINSTNWLSDQPISKWYGVTMWQNRVAGLDLSANNISGSIPPELGNLTNLELLILSNNQTTGPIPSTIGNLTKLFKIDIDNNLLTGSLPSTIGNLTNLLYVYLNNNQLTDSIPSTIGKLIHLLDLRLFSNQLTGSIPSTIGTLTSLQYLDISSNKLSGSIPPTIGNLTSLQYIDLYNNQLSGSIPSTIGNMTNLQKLDLYSNKLVDSIPASIGNLNNLVVLALGYNQLSGSIPPIIGSLTDLIFIGLDNNQLTDSIPSTFGNLINLTSLYLGNNQLTGSIPTELFNDSMLVRLELPYNKLNGAIPVEINKLKNLDWLYLNNNDFTDLPALTFSGSFLVVDVRQNAFTFEDFEPNITLNIQYDPQDSIGVKESVYRNTGSSFSISVSCGGANNFYQWYKNGLLIPDATSSTFTLNNVKFEASGIYACEVTNTLVKELAIHSRPVNLIVTAATPVEEINETHIRIYPNPVKDVLHFDGIQGQSAADIYNAEGKFITNTIIRDNQINTSSLSPGTYIVKIQDQSGTKIGKFIKP